MKKALSMIIAMALVLTALPAQAVREETRSEVKLAVMQGPTGFSSSMLGDFIEVSVYPSPNEAVAKLVNGELDMAALPANTAANLYNKGTDLKIVAVIGEGMLKVIGTSKDSRTLNVPGAGGTPDHMAELLYSQYETDYSISAPAQLAQMLIAGKVELAILPEPFVTMATRQNPDIKVFSNVQEEWAEKTGTSQYPMSVLVASAGFAEEHRVLLEAVMESYRNSVHSISEDPEAAGERIQELGIMNAAMATPALPDCNLVFKSGTEARAELEAYYKVLLDLAPAAIGNKLPDSGIWL